MRRIKVNAYEVAVVTQMGALVRILTQGKYWVSWSQVVRRFDITRPFPQGSELDLFLKNELFTNMVDLIEVKDHEVALQYKSGNFHALLKPGRHAFWKGVMDYTFDIYDLNADEVPAQINKKLLERAELVPYLVTHQVESYEKGILFVDRKFQQILEPGLYHFWRNGKSYQLFKADLRTQMLEVSGQELLTKDKAAIRLNFYANYQIVNIEKALIQTRDFAKQLYIQLQLALRAYIGTQTLDMLLANKAAIAPYVMDNARAKAEDMGLTISGAGIRDIILPGDVKEIMNQVLIAEKKAQAQVIMRREETASTRSLLNTAKLMEDNDMLYRLKEMEFIEKIAENVQTISLHGGNKVIDELKGLFGTK